MIHLHYSGSFFSRRRKRGRGNAVHVQDRQGTFGKGKRRGLFVILKRRDVFPTGSLDRHRKVVELSSSHGREYKASYSRMEIFSTREDVVLEERGEGSLLIDGVLGEGVSSNPLKAFSIWARKVHTLSSQRLGKGGPSTFTSARDLLSRGRLKIRSRRKNSVEGHRSGRRKSRTNVIQRRGYLGSCPL